MTPEIGDVVAGHRLLERIGENGGSGCLLYRAQDIGLNRTVAFKLLPKHFTENEGFHRRFEREAELAARINEHQSVVSIYQFGEVAGQLFLTMQYVNGRDLAQVIRTEGPLDVARTCVILEQVADALDTAHAAGLVHRDVKPGNIFVSSARGPLAGPITAYIGDFGLALPLGDPAKTTSLYYGTPGYVAPERRTGAPPTPLVDVYGLGCVAYACLTGSPPFDADSDSYNGAADPAPPALTTRYPHLTAAVDEVLARAVAWQPEHRYSRCGEFIAGDGGPATSASLNEPMGVALDQAGNIYIANRGSDRVRKVAKAGTITTIAGVGRFGHSPDGGQADESELASPGDVAVDAQGNVYVAELDGHRVRRVDPAGVITTVAGNGTKGFGGDGGPAKQAMLSSPNGIDVAADGTLYIADRENLRGRKVAPAGTITTFAGNGIEGNAGDGGPAVDGELEWPNAVSVDGAGNVYIADGRGNRVRKVDTRGEISTVLGTGTEGIPENGKEATGANVYAPSGVDVDQAGRLYVTDVDNDQVYLVDLDGRVRIVAGVSW